MTVRQIKKSGEKLPSKRQPRLVHKTLKAEAAYWDRQMENDAARGKLDFLIQEGNEALEKGSLKPFPGA